MDENGMGSAALVGLRLFDAASRRSGRTERMIERARDGDVIVCSQDREAQRVKALLRKAGKNTAVVHAKASPGSLSHIVQAVAFGARGGRVLFDHEFAYAYISAAIQDAEYDLTRVANMVGAKRPLAEDFATVPIIAERMMTIPPKGGAA